MAFAKNHCAQVTQVTVLAKSCSATITNKHYKYTKSCIYASYHWIFDDGKKINNICSISQILKNLDFSFDFFLLDRLSETQQQTRRIICIRLLNAKGVNF